MTFHKYPKIHQIGHEDNKEMFTNPDHELIIEEKIDGANFRFMIKDGKIIFGSRTQELQENTGGNWKRCITYIKQKIESCINPPEHLIIYGENCVKHSIHYDFDKMPPFLGYDIYDLKTNKFFGYDEKKKVFDRLSMSPVPLIKRIRVRDFKGLTDADIPESAYGSIQAEGLIVKNYELQLMSKWVTTKFKEVNREVFGQSKKFAENDDERLIAMYCTNPRIDKIVFKLADEGQKIDMTLMEYLPKRVINDIYEEHAKEICWSSWSINFRNVRKKINARCAAVLKQIMTNNALAGQK